MPRLSDPDPPRPARATSGPHRPLRRIGGLLTVYLVILGILFVHGLALTVAAVVVNANPSPAGLSEPLPWSRIAFYVVTNVILAAYTVLLIRGISKKRKSAIRHNVGYAVLTAVCLVAWHFLGMKSTVGTLVDSLPGFAGVLYFARSARVRETLVGQTGV